MSCSNLLVSSRADCADMSERVETTCTTRPSVADAMSGWKAARATDLYARSDFDPLGPGDLFRRELAPLIESQADVKYDRSEWSLTDRLVERWPGYQVADGRSVRFRPSAN